MFPRDQIMHFWQEYPRGEVVSFSVSHIRIHVIGDTIYISLFRCSDRFSDCRATDFPFIANKSWGCLIKSSCPFTHQMHPLVLAYVTLFLPKSICVVVGGNDDLVTYSFCIEQLVVSVKEELPFFLICLCVAP